MFKKLQIKFISINMLLITIVLLLGFSTISLVNYNSLKTETLKNLNRELNGVKRGNMYKTEIGKLKNYSFSPIIPTFKIELDSSYNILNINTNNFIVSDATIEKVIAYVKSSDEDSGIIRELNLRYKKLHSSQGYKIAFADRSREIINFNNLSFTLIVIGIITLLVFLVISIFLSKWALTPVRKSWEQQKQFLADASHELKTPLTIILANLKILKSHKSSTIQKELRWIENSNTEALRMKELLNSMLFLAKSEYSEMSTLHSKIDFSDIVIGKLLTFESIAYERGLTLKDNIENNLFLQGDSTQLKQLITILLDNACKYSKQNTEITVDLLKNQRNIVLMVSNIGSNLSDEDLNHIFERFYRVEDSRAREQGGYGLGLSIAQSIIESHNGKIKAESFDSNGIRFIATLPNLYN